MENCEEPSVIRMLTDFDIDHDGVVDEHGLDVLRDALNYQVISTAEVMSCQILIFFSNNICEYRL